MSNFTTNLAVAPANGGPVPIAPKLDAASALARYGFSVFPLIPNEKRPLIENWRNLATNDLAQIKTWWHAQPDANIGVSTETLLVIDVDPRNGGDATFRALFEAGVLSGEEFPPTLAAGTQGRGTHMFYWLPPHTSVRGGANKLGPGVDVKSHGGYVVGAGSTIDGRPYFWKKGYEPDKRDFAEAPSWLIANCNMAKPKSADAGKVIVLEDERAILLCRNWMADHSPHANIGERGYTAFKVACRFYDFGVSKETCIELLADWSEEHCEAPMDREDIEHAAYSAQRNRENAIGAKHPDAPGFEAVNIEPQSTTSSATTAEDVCPVSIRDVQIRIVPSIQELVPGLIERGTVTFLSAPGGKHKSRVAVQLGLCLGSGTPVFGRPVARTPLVYLSYEDHADEVARRVQAMTRRLQLPAIPNSFYWDLTSKDLPLAVVHESGACELKPFYDRLHRHLKSIDGHKFVVLDGTYNALRFAGQAKINETSVVAAISLLQRLCIETDSTILTLWHPSQSGQERGDASGWSVAWHNAPRARLSLSSVPDSEDAFDLKVEKRNHGPKGQPIRLYWSDGVLLPRTEVAAAEEEDRFRRAVVGVAIKAAEQGMPLQKQRHPDRWVLDDLEQSTGRRPALREVKEVLAAEAVLGDAICFVPGAKGQMAGYYPLTTAAELARGAKRHRQSPKAGR